MQIPFARPAQGRIFGIYYKKLLILLFLLLTIRHELLPPHRVTPEAHRCATAPTDWTTAILRRTIYPPSDSRISLCFASYAGRGWQALASNALPQACRLLISHMQYACTMHTITDWYVLAMFNAGEYRCYRRFLLRLQWRHARHQQTRR